MLTDLLVTVTSADSAQALLSGFLQAFLNPESLAPRSIFAKDFGKHPLHDLPSGGIVHRLSQQVYTFLLIVLELIKR